MDFKSLVHEMTPEEYANAYRTLDSRATDRPTDISELAIRAIQESIDTSTTSLLDVGCGRGYVLGRIGESKPRTALTGCDVYDHVDIQGADYKQGNITDLPFADGSFDIVMATCILEHVVDIEKAVQELKRVARKQVIIAVPCQRYYYYTLDMHIHFFPLKSDVERVINMPKHTCKNIRGDWIYVGEKL